MAFQGSVRLAAWIFAALLLAAFPRPASAVEVPGVGWEGQGADLAVLSLNGNSRPDMILMAYDNPSGANSFRYRIGLDLDANGIAASWLPGYIEVPGVGWEGQGAGMAVAYLDSDPRPELILMAYDNPSGANSFRYKIGWDLDASGHATHWTDHAQVPGVGWEGQGAAVVIGQIDSNPRPDLIFVAYDNPSGANSFRYRVGFNVDAQGNASWSPDYVRVDGVGWEGQGAGAALASLDSNPRPDLVLMAYDNPSQANSFRYRTVFNLDGTGHGSSWLPVQTEVPGLGWEGQGAGLAITCLDADPRADWIVMAYDNPSGANSFRYSVLPNHSQAPCPAAGQPIRKSITQLSAAEVASLRKGFAQMIAWNSAPRTSPEFRRSLIYWANMHLYFGSDCANPNDSQQGINQPGMTGVTTWSQTNSNEQATWCKCEHGSIQFLTWHRMYLYYFERVLQAAAGDPSLRLPYFDYETDAHLPAAYRDATYVDGNGQTRPNPLRIENRRTALNTGSGTISSASTSTSGAMAQTGFNAFSDQLEQTPHGAVHCAIGVSGCPTGYMGAVPAAGLDPIFYSHHANIDRLYECWLKVNQAARLPTNSAQLNTQFSFVDGDGSIVTHKVADMLTTAQLGYAYTGGGGCPIVPLSATASVPGLRAAAVRSFAVHGPVALERGVTRLPVAVESPLRTMLSAGPSAGGRSLLVLDGLSFDEVPGVNYDVYLQTADGRRALVGVINFFGRTRGGHAGHGMADMRPSDRIELDATAALRTLGGNAGQPTLVIEPDTGVAEDGPVKAAERISPRANVRFKSVRIEVEQ